MWVDAHVHFWQLAHKHPIGINERIAGLARDFNIEDLEPICMALDVNRLVLVQAASSTGETDFLLQLQERRPDLIAAVVGWVDLSSPAVGAELERRRAHRGFVGVREMAAFTDDCNYLLGASFQRGLQALAARDLSFDLVTRPDQLRVACEVVARNPGLKVNINHCGRPVVQCRQWSPWADGMAALARLPNATCKLSGLIERSGFEWSVGDLKAYVSHLLDNFGSERLLFASNWPVVNLAGTYERWWSAVQELLDALGVSSVDRNNILRDAAARFYALDR